MHADTRNGGLRTKRRLPAKFHTSPAHQDLLKCKIGRFPPSRFLKYPQVTADHITAPKSANSRFFTDCYPIYAAFAPSVNQITPHSATLSGGHSITKYIINHLKSVT